MGSRSGGAWVTGVLMVAVALLSACTSQAVQASLDRSSAPLLVPTGEWREAFEFTAPPGSTDLYQTRWNFRAGGTGGVTGWQVAASTSYDQAAIAEGPGQELVDEVLDAARGQGCTAVDAQVALQLCTYPAEFALGGVNAYLVRLIGNAVVVVDYSNRGGDRSAFNADSNEAQYIMSDFEPVPIDGAIDDFLVVIY